MRTNLILSILFVLIFTFDSFGAALEIGDIAVDCQSRPVCPVARFLEENVFSSDRFSKRATETIMPILPARDHNKAPSGHLVVANVSDEKRKSPLIGMLADVCQLPILEDEMLQCKDFGEHVYVNQPGYKGCKFLRGLFSRVLVNEKSGKKFAEIALGPDVGKGAPRMLLLPMDKVLPGLIWKVKRSAE